MPGESVTHGGQILAVRGFFTQRRKEANEGPIDCRKSSFASLRLCARNLFWAFSSAACAFKIEDPISASPHQNDTTHNQEKVQRGYAQTDIFQNCDCNRLLADINWNCQCWYQDQNAPDQWRTNLRKHQLHQRQTPAQRDQQRSDGCDPAVRFAPQHPDHAGRKGLHDPTIRSAGDNRHDSKQHHAVATNGSNQRRCCNFNHHDERHRRAQTDVWLHCASHHHDDADEVVAWCVLDGRHEDGDRRLVHRRSLRTRLRQQPRLHKLHAKGEWWLPRSLRVQDDRDSQEGFCGLGKDHDVWSWRYGELFDHQRSRRVFTGDSRCESVRRAGGLSRSRRFRKRFRRYLWRSGIE